MAQTLTLTLIPNLVVAVDDSDHSYHALKWTLDRFFSSPKAPRFRLVVVHARPMATSVLSCAGAGCLYLTDSGKSSYGVVVNRSWICWLGGNFRAILLVAGFFMVERSQECRGSAEVLPYIDSCLERASSRVVEKAKELCESKLIKDVVFEVVEGDARFVICDAVDKYHADILVVGSHGYGIIKRAVLGSVSDYCAHHAHCSVTIVKKPKSKH